MTRVLLFVLAASALMCAQTPVSIQNNGPIGSRVDILILGDGYTSAQLPQFAADVNSTLATFFAQDPWKSYKKFINVNRLDLASAQSGASHPENGITVNNAYGSSYNCAGIQRLICVDTTKVFNAIQNIPQAQRDIVLVLVNDTVYGGSGGQYAVASLNSSSVEIALHEIGHSFALLADEYGGPPPPACDESHEPSQADATLQTNRALIKWAPWIAPSTAVPTLNTIASTPGLYQGADYCDTGMYRPTYMSKMRALGFPYDQINTEQFVRQYYGIVAPIDSVLPAGTTVALTQGQSQAFVITPPSLDVNTIGASWTLDGSAAPGGTGLTYNLNTLSLAPGMHTLTATVNDATTLVRTDPQSRLTELRSWTISLAPANCTYQLSSAGATAASGASTGSFNITAGSGCGWTAASDNGKVTITSGTPGSGNGTVNYSVLANSGLARTAGTITITGVSFTATYTVNQFSSVNELDTASRTASPGVVTQVPVTVSLSSSTTLDMLVLTVTLTANGGAPAPNSLLAFADAGGRSVGTTSANSTITLTYVGLNPVLSGTVNLGNILVSLPANATQGQTYTIALSAISASSGGSTKVVNAGASNTITYYTAYTVGDIFPSPGIGAGSFGNNTIDTTDLLAELRAVSGIVVPPTCSDLYDAMDANGDGLLQTVDLLAELRRAANIDQTRPTRTSRGGVCPSVAPQAKDHRKPDGTLLFGEVEYVAGEERVPMYIEAAAEIHLSGLTLGLVCESCTWSYERPPSISDSSIPGKLALAWLEPRDAKAGERILLGYVKSESTVQVLNISANDAETGRALRLVAAH